MVDFLFRHHMNVSSEPIAYPINNHHRHILNGTHSPMYTNATPTAVNTKLRTNQTRKSRITLHSYYDFTDIRPLNIGNNSGTTNLGTNFSNIAAEKLLERSKGLRLGRISTHHHSRPSVLSSTSSANQPSLIWPSYNAQNGSAKQPQTTNSPTVSSTALVLPVNKLLTGGNAPDIHQHTSRTQTIPCQPLTEQQNTSVVIEPRHKSLPKTKPSMPKAYYRAASRGRSSYPVPQNQPLQILHKKHSKHSKNTYENIGHLYESEEDEENIPMIDAEYEEYVQKSIVKCADWLIKYVFDQKYDENNE